MKIVHSEAGIEVVFDPNGLCLMAQKDDAAARKAWGRFSINKPHYLLFITQKNRQTTYITSCLHSHQYFRQSWVPYFLKSNRYSYSQHFYTVVQSALIF